MLLLTATISDHTTFTDETTNGPNGEPYVMTIELHRSDFENMFTIRYHDNVNGDGDSMPIDDFYEARETWAREVKRTADAVTNPPY